MNINVFHLDYAQPFVWVALLLLSIVSLSALLPPHEVEDSKLFIFFPRLKWFYKAILVVVTIIWLVVVILNHQTFWVDVINFVFLLGFSGVWLYVMLLVYLLVFAAVCILSGIVLSLYALLIFIIVCTGKLFVDIFK